MEASVLQCPESTKVFTDSVHGGIKAIKYAENSDSYSDSRSNMSTRGYDGNSPLAGQSEESSYGAIENENEEEAEVRDGQSATRP